jgi:hypothetical protein
MMIYLAQNRVGGIKLKVMIINLIINTIKIISQNMIVLSKLTKIYDK